MINVDFHNYNPKIDAEIYKKTGYCIGPSLIEEEEINHLRNLIESSFSKKNYPRGISVFDLENEEAIKIILKILNSEWINSVLKKIESAHKTPVSILPTFDIQRNYHVDRLNAPGIGWHRDCGGELEYDYCKKILDNDSYVFGKIGIYLQNNEEYGGSIDLIPYSHKYTSNKKWISKKIYHIPLKILKSIQICFPKIYKLFSESLSMKLIRAKKLFPKKASPVFFSSKMIHRGSPILDKVRNEVSFLDKFQAKTPKTKTKFSIYTHFGSSIAVDSYMYDRLKRGITAEIDGRGSLELKRWIKEQKILEDLSPKLGLMIKNILDPIVNQYNKFV